MRLTANTLAELIRSLRSNPPEGQEKRQHPRVGLRARAEITRLIEPDRAITAWVRDVSAGGMNFTLPLPLSEGELFTLVLGPDETMTCAAMHCRKVAPNVYAIGAKFEDSPGSPRPRVPFGL